MQRSFYFDARGYPSISLSVNMSVLGSRIAGRERSRYFSENASNCARSLPFPESKRLFRITPQPLRRQAEDYLRKAIMDGVFAAGEQLSDRLLCEQLGVSRRVVREAVRPSRSRVHI
jgi:hypothetical protein